MGEAVSVQDEARAIRERAEKAEAAIERVRALHKPVPTYTERCGEWHCDRQHVEDFDGDLYHLDGPTKDVCGVCSYMEDNGYGTLANIPFPCPTVAALDGGS